MLPHFSRSISFVRVVASRLLLLLLLILPGCSDKNSPDNPDETTQTSASSTETLVCVTDSAEWYVKLFYTGLVYSEASAKTIPEPYHVPTREEAKILKDLSYPHNERFITSDGYTFGMPSSSVTKAGSKTKYSVLGLRIRITVITIEF